MYSIGIPVVGATLVMVETGAEKTVAIGDELEVTVHAGFNDPRVVSGTVAAISLRPIVVDGNPDHKVLDNIPMKDWSNPICAKINDAVQEYEVESLLIKVDVTPEAEADSEEEPEPVYDYVKVDVNMILEVAGAEVPAEDTAATDDPVEEETPTETV